MLAVPSSSLSICAALRQLEDVTWRELKAGFDCRQRLDEESVTSYHLMRLATAVADLAVEKHHRGRESRTGADWEWWIGRPGAYVGFRMQAKLLDASSAQYKALFSTQGTALRQVDKLIKSAETAGQPCYPLYCFYNYWIPRPAFERHWPCPRPAASPTAVGWTVVSAYEVRARLADWQPSRKIWEYSSVMYPISCLLCCDCGRADSDRASNLASRVARNVAARWSDWASPRVLQTAPAYVERIAKGQAETTGWQDYADEFRPASREIPSGLSRVVLLRDSGGAA